MSDYSLGDLDRASAPQDLIGVWSPGEISFVNTQSRTKMVGILTAMCGVVAMGEQDISHHAKRLILCRKRFAPAGSVDHEDSSWAN